MDSGQVIKATDYDRFYMNGGFKYSSKSMKAMLVRNTSLFDNPPSDKKKTLLDVGCGDGFWSHLFSDHYNVTAEDSSLGGVMMGSLKDAEDKITWICGDSTSLSSVHDIVFARCPSFFNRPIDDQIFLKSFEHIWSRVGKKFYWITASSKPFLRQIGSNWYHDPSLLKKFF